MTKNAAQNFKLEPLKKWSMKANNYVSTSIFWNIEFDTLQFSNRNVAGAFQKLSWHADSTNRLQKCTLDSQNKNLLLKNRGFLRLFVATGW